MKKTKKLSLTGILCITLAVLVCLVAAMLIGMKVTDNNQDAAPAEPQAVIETEAPTTVPTEPLVAETEVPIREVAYGSGKLETPFMTLYYNDALSDNLAVVSRGENPYILEFYAMLENRPEQRIFDITMGTEMEGNLGTVQTQQGKVAVSATVYQFNPDSTWRQDEINTVLAMQDVVNDLIGQMALEKKETAEQDSLFTDDVPESSVVNYIPIRTPYCTLQYPTLWKDYITWEETQGEVYKVAFIARVGDREPIKLFTVLLGGDEGDQLGAIKTDLGEIITVNVMIEALDLKGWSEEDASTVFGMQEALNLMIGQLPLL